MGRRTYANAVLEEEETKMMETILRKYSRFRGKKDAVLVEALRMYYQNQESTRWRQVKPPTG